nr:hypothetical protein [Leptolyngbya sp. KIOST-1]
MVDADQRALANIALPELGQHGVVYDGLGDPVVAAIVAHAQLDADLAIAGGHQQQNAVVASGIANPPGIEQVGGKGFEGGIARAVVVDRVYRQQHRVDSSATAKLV